MLPMVMLQPLMDQAVLRSRPLLVEVAEQVRSQLSLQYLEMVQPAILSLLRTRPLVIPR